MFNEGDNLVSTPGICSYKIAGKYRRDLGVFAVRPGGPWWALCLMRAPPPPYCLIFKAKLIRSSLQAHSYKHM